MQTTPEFSLSIRIISGMGKALLTCSFLLAGALAAASPLRAATVNYTGLATGKLSTDWNNRTNWSPAIVPAAPDDAVISSGTVVLPPTATFASLTIVGATVKGVFTNKGIIRWTSGTLGGQVTIAPGGVLELSGNDQKNLEECTINNAGTIRWGGTGGLQSSTAVVINNQAGGLFDAQNDSSLQHFSFSVPAVFNNAGVFRKSGGTGVTAIQRVAFNNSGKVEIPTGTLSFPDGFANSGTFDVAAGARLDLSGGKVILQPGGTLTGGGFYGVTGKVDVEGTINSTNFQLTGTLEGTNTLTGRMVWTSGTIKSKLTIVTGGALELSGHDQKNLEENTINNAGTIRWGGTGGLQSSTAVVINNQVGGLFEAKNDGSLQHFSFSVPAVFNNAGVFRKSGSTGVTAIQNVAFNNSGRVEIQSGTLDFSGDYPQSAGGTFLDGGTLKAPAIRIDGGVLGGVGIVSGNVFNRAQLSPTALAIEGDFAQTAEGALNFSIGGLFGGSQFDTLTVSGKAALNGSLNLTLTNAFRPRPGNSFQVMTYASSAGAFAAMKGLDLGGGTILKADFHPKALVVSLPSPFTLSRTTDGQFKFRFEGQVGVSYRLEASADLVNWVALNPNPLAGIIEFTDAESVNLPRRYYRLRTP